MTLARQLASSPTSAATSAPTPEQFPKHAIAWHYFCRTDEIQSAPLPRELCGQSLIAWRSNSGAYTIMDARCSHLGADLARGVVQGDCLQCPFHHWQYGTDGRCTSIAAQGEIPPFARQHTYPAATLGPFLFMFNGPQALYPLPFFPGQNPSDFRPARPYIATLNCPWYLIGSNAFDRQHFNAAHDRKLTADPAIDSPAPFARRAIAEFAVVGTSWQDRATRLLSGSKVTLTCTDWAGTLIFVTARFQKSASFGMVSVRAVEPRKTEVRVIVWVPRGKAWLARLLRDPLERSLRRYFVCKFLESDVANLQGCQYQPHRLIAADRDLAAYFSWLARAAGGQPVLSGSD